MGRPTGLEPATSGTTNRRSNQLSYGRHISDERRMKRPRQRAANRRASPRSSSIVRTRFPAKTRAMAANDLVDMATSGTDRTAARLAAVHGIRRAPTPKLQQFMLSGFLDAETCAALIAQIDRDVRPSTIADPNGDEAFRTSTTCDLDHRDPLVIAVNNRLHDLTGIPLAFGEPMQGQRYDVGQEFKAHTDYFDPGGIDFDRYCSVAGQRTWTFMVYLNAV